MVDDYQQMTKTIDTRTIDIDANNRTTEVGEIEETEEEAEEEEEGRLVVEVDTIEVVEDQIMMDEDSISKTNLRNSNWKL